MKFNTLAFTATAVALFAATPAAKAETIFAIADGGALISFTSMDPGTVISNVGIMGLAMGETLVGIDFRPSNRRLYGVSDASKLYEINTKTGAASQVGMGSFNVPLMGSFFGVDFNPTVDLLRIVSNTGQNLRVGPTDGIVRTNLSPAGDLTLNYVPGTAAQGIVAAGYTNSLPTATTTTLYVIDSILDQLAIQGPNPPAQGPNQGVLGVVGPLGFNPTPRTGFDISGFTGTSYVSSGNNLWALDLSLETSPILLGPIGSGLGLEIADISVAPAPEPSTWAMLATGFVGILAAVRRRRKA